MQDLTESQSQRALDAALELAELRELAEFPRRASELLRQLLPCEHAGYNAIDVASHEATVIADPPECVFEGGPEALALFGAQNPILVRATEGDTNALRLSDHITRRELHRTELYNEVYRVVGLEYQLGVRLPAVRRELGRPAEMIGISLCRTRSDFTDDERALLHRVGPLFAATLERLHELALLRAIAPHGDATPWVLLVDAHDELAWTSEAALTGLGLVVGGRLPASLASWLDGARAGTRSGTVALDGRQLMARIVLGAYPGLDAIHLTPVAQGLDETALRRLGLTRRQSEVLALALEGLTSPEIARRLTLSPRTVEKHFDAIYSRLGVRNRSQAILAVMRAQSAV